MIVVATTLYDRTINEALGWKGGDCIGVYAYHNITNLTINILRRLKTRDDGVLIILYIP